MDAATEDEELPEGVARAGQIPTGPGGGAALTRAEQRPAEVPAQQHGLSVVLGLSPDQQDRVDVAEDGDVGVVQATQRRTVQQHDLSVALGLSPDQQDRVFADVAEDVGVMQATRRRTMHQHGLSAALGLSQDKRDRVFADVALRGDVQLCSNLIAAGVNPRLQDRVLCGALEQGRVAFVVDLLRRTADNAIVLDMAHGSGVLERRLGSFTREAMPSAVKTTLVQCVITLDQSDAVRELLRCYRASETETELLFDTALSCQNGEALLVLVSYANRNSRLLKEFCLLRSISMYPPEIFAWICEVLKDRYIALSVDIALDANCREFVEDVVLCSETSKKVRRMVLQKVCAESKDLFHTIAEKLVDRHPCYRRTLFLMSVRQGYYAVASTLYGPGVSARDFIYALEAQYSTQQYNSQVDKNNSALPRAVDCCYDDYILAAYHSKLSLAGDSLKHDKLVVKTCMDYFVSKGERGSEFVSRFGRYCGWEDADGDFVMRVFKRAYRAAVRWDREDCFVESIVHVMEFRRKEGRRKMPEADPQTETSVNSMILAFTHFFVKRQVFRTETYRKVVAAIDFALKKQKFSFVLQILDKDDYKLKPCVLKRAFKAKAWPVFEKLFAADDSDFTCCGKVFIHCLSRAVAQASDTETVGDSNTATDGVSDTASVGDSDTATDGDSDKATVGDSDKATVGDSDKATVGDSNTTVGDSNTATVGDSDTATVGDSNTATVGDSNTATVGDSNTATVGESDKATVGDLETATVGDSETATAEDSDTATVGAVRMLDKWLHRMCGFRDTSLFKEEKNWSTPGCVLREELGADMKLGQRPRDILRYAEFSRRHGCHGLALFLAAVLGADEGRELMDRVLASHMHSLNPHLLADLACFAVKALGNPAGVAAVLLKHVPLSAFFSDPWYLDFSEFCQTLTSRTGSSEMIAALRGQDAHHWVLVVQLVVAEDFPAAEETLTTSCGGAQECVDVVMHCAAETSRTDVFCRHASQRSKPAFLRWLLYVKLRDCRAKDAGIVRRLLDLVGTCHGGASATNSSLSEFCDWWKDRLPRGAAGLARSLVSQGASAQHRRMEGPDGRIRDCPLKKASRRRDLALVKLFHRAGLCSNRRLFRLAEFSYGRGFWRRRDASSGDDDDVPVDKAVIQSYLTFAASCPLSLQDLCRHAVSSSLGGRPGYVQRVRALPLPALVQEHVLFSDLTGDQSHDEPSTQGADPDAMSDGERYTDSDTETDTDTYMDTGEDTESD